MAIAQSGIESGWGTSFAARNGNALFGQIQASGRHAVSVPWKPGTGMPQPFTNVGEAAEAYVSNLNTHPAYAAFRNERAAMRQRGEAPDGYRLVGQLVTLFRARPAVCRLRAPGDARGQAHRLRQGEAVGF